LPFELTDQWKPPEGCARAGGQFHGTAAEVRGPDCLYWCAKRMEFSNESAKPKCSCRE
jgi:hypothetical protein